MMKRERERERDKYYQYQKVERQLNCTKLDGMDKKGKREFSCMPLKKSK